MSRLHAISRAAKTAEDGRTADQTRADMFLDSRHNDTAPSTRRAVVDVRVDLTTLAGLSETAAEIPGWGPVIADIARQIAEDQPDAEWRIAVIDQDQILWDGTTRRRPTVGLRR
jgi:hypothetical protein